MSRSLLKALNIEAYPGYHQVRDALNKCHKDHYDYHYFTCLHIVSLPSTYRQTTVGNRKSREKRAIVDANKYSNRWHFFFNSTRYDMETCNGRGAFNQ